MPARARSDGFSRENCLGVVTQLAPDGHDQSAAKLERCAPVSIPLEGRKLMKRSTAMGSMAIVLLLATPAWATNYDESVNGDLSGDRLNPTHITLAPGANLITATAVSANQPPPTG